MEQYGSQRDPTLGRGPHKTAPTFHKQSIVSFSMYPIPQSSAEVTHGVNGEHPLITK